MDTIDGMKTVIAVVETGSFTAASQRLGISKALTSKYVGEVESRAGVRLFNRSTRRLALTEVGQLYYDRAVGLVDAFDELSDQLSGDQSTIRGLLKINAPVIFGEMFIAPLLPAYKRLNPLIRVELQLNPKVIDMLEAGIDLVFRVGEVKDSNLVAKKIKPIPFALCVSPSYWSKPNLPTRLSDLEGHEFVMDQNFKGQNILSLINPSGKRENLEMNSSLSADNPAAVREIALAGGGIILLPRFVVEAELASGRLIELLPDHQLEEAGLYAIYPHRQFLPKKVSSFVAFFIEQIEGQLIR